MATKLYSWIAKGGTSYYFRKDELTDTQSYIDRFIRLENARIKAFPSTDQSAMKGRLDKAVSALKKDFAHKTSTDIFGDVVDIKDKIKYITDEPSLQVTKKKIPTVPEIFEDALEGVADTRGKRIVTVDIRKEQLALDKKIKKLKPTQLEKASKYIKPTWPATIKDKEYDKIRVKRETEIKALDISLAPYIKPGYRAVDIQRRAKKADVAGTAIADDLQRRAKLQVQHYDQFAKRIREARDIKSVEDIDLVEIDLKADVVLSPKGKAGLQERLDATRDLIS